MNPEFGVLRRGFGINIDLNYKYNYPVERERERAAGVAAALWQHAARSHSGSTVASGSYSVRRLKRANYLKHSPVSALPKE